MLDPAPQWNKGITVTQRVCHPSSLPYALFFNWVFFFFFFNPTTRSSWRPPNKLKKGVFWFLIGLQKSTSQPELSSGGGSSLSSGKLSKLLVSIADVTWWTEKRIARKSSNISNENLMRVSQTYVRDNRRCQRPFLQTLPVKALKPSTAAPVRQSLNGHLNI